MVLAKTLFILAGADPRVLAREECRRDRAVMMTSGGAVLISSLLATSSGVALALTLTASLPIAVLCGAGYGMTMFIMDRSLILSVPKSKQSSVVALIPRILPRLLLSVLASIAVSKPLEMALFSAEIEQKIVEVEAEKQKTLQQSLLLENPEISALTTSLNAVDKDIAFLSAQERKDYLSAQQEAYGEGGTGLEGTGPVFDQKLALAERTSKSLQEKRQERARLLERIKELQTTIHDSIERASEKSPNSLLTRLFALEALQDEDRRIAAIVQIINLMNLLLDLSPILIKLFSPPGVYDSIIEHEDGLQTQFYAYEAQVQREQQEYDAQARMSNAHHLMGLIHQAIAEEFPRLIERSMSSAQYKEVQEKIIAQIITRFERELEIYAGRITVSAKEVSDTLRDVVTGLKKEILESRVYTEAVAETIDSVIPPDPWLDTPTNT